MEGINSETQDSQTLRDTQCPAVNTENLCYNDDKIFTLEFGGLLP